MITNIEIGIEDHRSGDRFFVRYDDDGENKTTAKSWTWREDAEKYSRYLESLNK